ncbi:MAG: hypothetical protein RSD49_04855 [Hafnia sp.]
MKSQSPVNYLSTKATYIWFACTVIGITLNFFDNQSVAQLGKTLFAMGFGYVIFGLGIERIPQETDETKIQKEIEKE